MLLTQEQSNTSVDKLIFFHEGNFKTISEFRKTLRESPDNDSNLNIIWDGINKKGNVVLGNKHLCSIIENENSEAVLTFAGEMDDIEEKKNLFYENIKKIEGISYRRPETLVYKDDIRNAYFSKKSKTIRGEELAEELENLPLNDDTVLSMEWNSKNKTGNLCIKDNSSGEKVNLCSMSENEKGVFKLTIPFGSIKRRQELLNTVFELIGESKGIKVKDYDIAVNYLAQPKNFYPMLSC